MFTRKMQIRVWSVAVASGVAGVLGQRADAAVIMDQIGTSPAFITGQNNGFTSDVFESTFAADDVAVVDNFTVSGPSLLTKVFAVTDGFDGFTSYSGVTGWGVEIYSSLAAATSNLAGDVYSKNFAPASVNLTTPFGGNTDAALFNVSTSITLPTAGTYYLAVIAANSFANNGEVGIFATTGVTGANPGGTNAYQVNPSGGFGFAGNQNPLLLDAAYAIQGVTTAVPEPTTVLGITVVSGMIGLSRRKSALRV